MSMSLRPRNANISNLQNGAIKPNVDPPAKRGASKQAPSADNQGEPKAKRAVLTDLTTKLSSGLVIDSVRKGLGIRKAVTRNARSNSVSELVAGKLAPLAKAEILEDGIEEEVTPKPQVVDPCPGYDYDAENKNDPYNVPDYAFDIFLYYKDRETAYAVGDYLKKHPKISKESRAVLVDWMIEVQETFELNHETLYLAVKLVDTYLNNSKRKVQTDQLQLIASAAVFVASKYEERSPPLLDDFIYLAEDSFTKEALEVAERDLFHTVSFDLGAPLSYSHLRRYAKASKVDMQVLTLARYILETSLMFYEFVSASESKMASGAFLLALRMMNKDAVWTPVMHKYSGYAAAEVEPWAAMLNHMLHIRKSGGGVYSQQHTVSDKYSHEIFYQSANVPLIKDTFALKDPLVCPK